MTDLEILHSKVFSDDRLKVSPIHEDSIMEPYKEDEIKHIDLGSREI